MLPFEFGFPRLGYSLRHPFSCPLIRNKLAQNQPFICKETALTTNNWCWFTKLDTETRARPNRMKLNSTDFRRKADCSITYIHICDKYITQYGFSGLFYFLTMSCSMPLFPKAYDCIHIQSPTAPALCLLFFKKGMNQGSFVVCLQEG